MKTKEKVLEILKNSGSSFVSGQEIADEIYVTRASVWKAIKALEKEGHVIEAVTNKGYRLQIDNVLPKKSDILELVGSNVLGDIVIYDSLDSTNEEAKRVAMDANGNCVIIAGRQTDGHGRRGRGFYSPEKTGIYMSFLLKDSMPMQKATMLTGMMAVAVCEAIENVTGVEASIKWVNDIYVQGKKAAGILTEAIGTIEDGYLNSVVIGVGINLYLPFEGFPSDIAKEAGSVLSGAVDNDVRDRLYAAVIAQFNKYYDAEDENAFIDFYRERSFLIGHYVKLRTPDHETKRDTKGYAYAYGIDDNCRLLVRYDDGSEEALSCGEVSAIKY